MAADSSGETGDSDVSAGERASRLVSARRVVYGGAGLSLYRRLALVIYAEASAINVGAHAVLSHCLVVHRPYIAYRRRLLAHPIAYLTSCFQPSQMAPAVY